MSEFSDQYFHDLPPRQRRYDTPVSEQLHFCVFPNGVKSWVFLYEVDGYLRRRTIGLFPEMGYKDALRALDPNRKIAEVDASEHRQPAKRPPMSMTLTLPPAVQRLLRRISLTDVLTAGGTAVVALAVLMFFGGADEPAPSEPSPVPVARTEQAPAQPLSTETRPTEARPTEARPTETRPAETRPTETGSAEPGAEAPGGMAASTSAPALPGSTPPADDDPARGTIRMASPAEQEPDPVTSFEDDPTPTDEDEPAPTDEGDPAPTDEDDPAPTDESPATDPADTDFEAEITEIGPVEDLTVEELEERGITGTAAAVRADEAASQQELLAGENEAAAGGPVEPVVDAEAAAVANQEDGALPPDNPLASGAAATDPPANQTPDDLTVRRALLAGDVINGEPRNTLSGTITVPAGGELLIYFYIEFADSIGEPVTHRWLNGGAVEEESAMQVDSAGGARVYTARVIGADRVGEWRVEAVTADGRLLRGLDFTVVAAEEEAPAATAADEPPAEPES